MLFEIVKRIADAVVALALLICLSWLVAIVAVAVRLTSPGPVLYWSDRIGRNGRVFSMPKFRSMPVNTPAVATHLLDAAELRLTPIGGLLRRSSIDEIPQLWSILRGDMSFVGPRPALFNQDDLIELRQQSGVDVLRPGVTGLAQINGRDSLTIPEKVRYDAEYLKTRGFVTDIRILLQTAWTVLRGDGVQH